MRGVNTHPCVTLEEARRRTLHLFREALENMPQVLSRYQMSGVDPEEVTERIKQLFRRHQGVEDLSVLNRLLVLAEMDLNEFVLMHKTPHHVYQVLAPQYIEDAFALSHIRPELKKTRSPFLQSFYAGKEIQK